MGTSFFSILLGVALATQAAEKPSREETLRVAREVITTARYATFVTLGRDGHPQARIVEPTAPSDDFIVWIGTNPQSRKVAELRRDPRATLLFFDSAGGAYVTLKGRVAVVVDAAEKERHFKEEWTSFYKDRHRGPDFLMLRFTPTALEISAEGKGIKNDRKTWTPTIVEFARRR